MTSERRQLLALLEHLEVPDCACPRMPLDCGCPEPCDCPVLLPPPCPCVLARDHGLTLMEWAELLALAFPTGYAEPGLCPAVPCQEMSREARSEVLAERHDQHQSLYHPLDPDPARPQQDRLAWELEQTDNYVHYAGNVVVLGRPKPPERPGWDAEMLQVLAIRHEQLGRRRRSLPHQPAT